MAIYKIDVTLDEGQDKILKKVAKEQEKSAQELIQAMTFPIVLQIDQWIADRIAIKLSKLSKADILARLEYFDNQ